MGETDWSKKKYYKVFFDNYNDSDDYFLVYLNESSVYDYNECGEEPFTHTKVEFHDGKVNDTNPFVRLTSPLYNKMDLVVSLSTMEEFADYLCDDKKKKRVEAYLQNLMVRRAKTEQQLIAEQIARQATESTRKLQLNSRINGLMKNI